MSIEVLNESGDRSVDVTGLSRLAPFVMDQMRVHPQAELCIKLVDEDDHRRAQREVDGEGRPDRRAGLPDGRAAARPGQRGPRGGRPRRPGALPRRSRSGRPRRPATPTRDEVELLTVHGILHLLGYDHAEPEEHKEMFGLQADAADAVAGRPSEPMSVVDVWLLVAGRGLSRWSPACSAAPTPRCRRSPRPAPRRSPPRARPGRARLLVIVEDPPRYLNTALFLRMLSEIAAIVLVTVVMLDLIVPAAARSPVRRPTAAAGGDARVAGDHAGRLVRRDRRRARARVGRQHSERVALLSRGPLIAFTKVLGPLPRLLILVGNAITPGRGFSEGPFASEAELRELVDLAEASSVIESGERQMIHSVFELGDTLVREVMVPRTDVVFIERAQDAAPGDVAGAAQRLLPDPGGRGEPRRHRRLRLPQGPHQAGLRPARGRDHRAGRVGDAAGALRPRLQADRRAAARDAGRAQARRRRRRRVRRHRRAWSPSRTSWRRSSARSPTSTTSARVDVEHLADGGVRVSSRFPVDDLEDVCRRRRRGRRRRQRRRADGQAPRPGPDRRLGRGGRTGCASRPRRPPGAATGSAPCWSRRLEPPTRPDADRTAGTRALP